VLSPARAAEIQVIQRMILTTAKVRSLPVPTESQWGTFTDHLLNVHSWYKHLPLLDGGEIVVVLSPDAGEGYPTDYPRLPCGNTVAGYRKAFGHLDYFHRRDRNEPFHRDGQATPELESDVLHACRFVMYPFVSPGIYWSVHEDAITQIRDGVEHPNAEAILAAYESDSKMEACWQDLSPDARETVLAIRRSDKAGINSAPPHIRRFLDLKRTAETLYNSLHVSETNRVRNCLAGIRCWLQN
ncbi:MAG: hypothetical protein AAFP69_18810, partial [Planctomycetota bacterium]